MYHHSCPNQSDYRYYPRKHCQPVRADLGFDLPGTVARCGQCLSSSHQTRLREIQTKDTDQCLVRMEFKQEQYTFPGLRENSQAETGQLAIARADENKCATRVARVKIESWWCGVVTAFVACRE